MRIDEGRPRVYTPPGRVAGVTNTDYERYTGDSGDSSPIVLGHEGAGVVEAVGDRVTGIEPGQPVVLTVTTYSGSCGL
jgi:Zn-dependent alcohol dehydrogenase